MNSNGHSSFPMGPRYGSHPYDNEYPRPLDYRGGHRWVWQEHPVRLAGQVADKPGVRHGVHRVELLAHSQAQHEAGQGRAPADADVLQPHSTPLTSPTASSRRYCPPSRREPSSSRTATCTPLSPGTAPAASTGTGCGASTPSPSGPPWLCTSKCPLDESIRRIVTGRDELGFYESGQDVMRSNKREKAFRKFQGAILDEYDSMSSEFGLVTIDATQPIHAQQEEVRDLVEPMLAGVMRMPDHGVTDALISTGLTGRYLQESGSRRVPELVSPTDG